MKQFCKRGHDWRSAASEEGFLLPGNSSCSQCKRLFWKERSIAADEIVAYKENAKRSRKQADENSPDRWIKEVSFNHNQNKKKVIVNGEKLVYYQDMFRSVDKKKAPLLQRRHGLRLRNNGVENVNQKPRLG